MKLNAEDDAQYKKIMSMIRPYVDEKFQAWILGTSDFKSDYPTFVKELKNRGIDEAIEIVQRGYEAYSHR